MANVAIRASLHPRLLTAAALILQTSLVTGGPPSVSADDCVSSAHCYSVARENSAGNGYTGVKEHRELRNVTNHGGWVYQTMWLMWSWSPMRWIEYGTAYGNGKQSDFAYLCRSATSCDFIYWRDIVPDGVHIYTITRDDGYNYWYRLKKDGDQVLLTTSDYTDGIEVSTGLESYNMTITFPAYASYYLKYRRLNNDFRDWAGEDNGNEDVGSIMCGKWHLPTSWWAGEHTSCQ